MESAGELRLLRGMGYLELAVLAEEIGRALAPIPFSTSGLEGIVAGRRHQHTEVQLIKDVRHQFEARVVTDQVAGTAVGYGEGGTEGRWYYWYLSLTQ